MSTLLNISDKIKLEATFPPLLLNTYSGAAAAYSLRKLDYFYSGDAIVVRRASDQTTQSIGFVNNELDTATLESFCSGTNGFVTTWYDQSGSGNDATQENASLQPKIVNSGSVILENGKPIIQNTSGCRLDIGLAVSNSFDLLQFSVYKNEIGRSILNTYEELGGDKFILASEDAQTSASTLLSVDSYLNGSLFDFSTRDIAWDNTLNQSLVTIHDSSHQVDLLRFLGWASASWSMPLIQEFIFYNSDQISNRIGIENNINNFYSIY